MCERVTLELKYAKDEHGGWSVRYRDAHRRWVDVGTNHRQEPKPRQGFALLCLISKIDMLDDPEASTQRATKGTLLYSFADTARNYPKWLNAIFGIAAKVTNPHAPVRTLHNAYEVQLKDVDISIQRGERALNEKDELIRLLEEIKICWTSDRITSKADGLLVELSRLQQDDGIFSSSVLVAAEESIREASARLEEFAELIERAESYSRTLPFVFRGQDVCTRAYVRALNVCRTFCTTTFLTSGFWRTNNAEVVEANQDMLTRLTGSGSGNVPENVRRIFLLSRPFDRESEQYAEQLRASGRSRGLEAVRGLRSQFDKIRSEMLTLMDGGCRVRVTYDSGEYWKHLPEIMHFDPQDSEIAIFDGEVHVYSGGSMGKIASLAVYDKRVEHFDTYYQRSREFFEQLWTSGIEGKEALQEFVVIQQRAEYGFDNDKHLWRWHKNLIAQRDVTLKQQECQRTRGVLEELGLWGKICRHLDVGTFSGRYLVALQEGVMARGKIVGVDIDPSCVEFARSVAAEVQDNRVEVFAYDYTSSSAPPFPGNFDVITCMMGTVAHFNGRGIDDSQGDGLRVAIRRFHDLLREGGVVLLSRWNGDDFLQMYTNWERERLRAWNPSVGVLEGIIAEEGLSIESRKSVEERLELLVLRKGSAKSNRRRPM